MKRLTILELKFLRSQYSKNGPKYVPTIGLLDHFIYRFENHPQWMYKVEFLTTNESTLKSGTFVMVYAMVDARYIAFNSLESAPYRNLQHLLNTLNYAEVNICTFLTVSEEFHKICWKLKMLKPYVTVPQNATCLNWTIIRRCKRLKSEENQKFLLVHLCFI